jgi:transposase
MPKTIISKDTYLAASQELKKLKIEGTLFRKLQAVKLAYEHSIKETAEFLNIFPVSIRNWAKLINNGQIDDLKIASKHKEGMKLKLIHKSNIKKWLSSDPNLTIEAVRLKLETKYQLIVSKSTVHRAMKDNGFSYITPRQNHYKQDKKITEDFKKKSTQSNKDR